MTRITTSVTSFSDLRLLAIKAYVSNLTAIVATLLGHRPSGVLVHDSAIGTTSSSRRRGRREALTIVLGSRRVIQGSRFTWFRVIGQGKQVQFISQALLLWLTESSFVIGHFCWKNKKYLMPFLLLPLIGAFDLKRLNSRERQSLKIDFI